MPRSISALPPSTVRLLGSSVAITTPCGLVKELVDNAIDAKATTVEVTVSSNLVDKLIVRDDGHGIEVDDFEALGRRTYTSKLTSFDQLGLRASETLGFRGEALASINSLSTVSITTRTSKDPVASRLQLKFGIGGVENLRPISAPVGTIVQVAKLFESLPARKQYTLKNVQKYMSSMKDALKAIALARPYLRLSFKILGDPTRSWSYAPNRASNVQEVILQLFGRSLATNCIQAFYNSEDHKGKSFAEGNCKEAQFTLHAYLQRGHVDNEGVKPKGTFISVDGRPLSSARGIAKRISDVFKSRLNQSMNVKGLSNVASPFMQLSIQCSPNSYDPNVTPLKDEIIFTDEKKILHYFEALCQNVYKEEDTLGDVDNSKSSSGCGAIPQGSSHSLHTLHSYDVTPLDPAINPSSHLNNSSTFESVDSTPPTTLPVGMNTVCPQDPQEPFKKPQTISSKIRLSNPVNMSRTESDVTDEDNIAGSMTVQIPVPPAPPKGPLLSRKLNRQLKSKLSNLTHQDIELYFRPQQSNDFPIAIDETATTGGQQESPEATRLSEVSGRIPLHPLSGGMLNMINGQEEPGSGTHSIETSVMRPASIETGDYGTISNVRSHDATDLDGQQLMIRYQPISPEGGPSTIAEFSSDARSSRVSYPYTPPSNPERRERYHNPTFRPPQRNSPTGNRFHVQNMPRASTNNRAQANLLRETRNSLDSARRIESSQRQISSPRVNASPLQIDSFTTQSRDISHSMNPMPSRRRVDNLHHSGISDSSAHSDIFQHTPEREPLRRKMLENVPSLNSDPYSHFSQTLLMRSPPPTIGQTENNGERGTSLEGLYHRPAQQEDPRRYLIQRQRSQARHSRPRRLSSRRLPLEVIPDSIKMQNVNRTMKCDVGDVKLWAMNVLLLGDGAGNREAGNSLRFKDVNEAHAVESRLQGVIHSWMQRSNEMVEIKYTWKPAAMSNCNA